MSRTRPNFVPMFEFGIVRVTEARGFTSKSERRQQVGWTVDFADGSRWQVTTTVGTQRVWGPAQAEVGSTG